jgi:predicted nucleic acid-binding protein
LIFLDTNVISETLRKTPNPAVTPWLVRNDAELALPTVTIAEIAFGIGKIRPDQRAARLEQGLAAWRHRFADRIFPFTEAAALAYGDVMSAAPTGPTHDRARRNDRRHCAHQRRPLRDPELAGLRNDRPRTHLSMGFLRQFVGQVSEM